MLVIFYVFNFTNDGHLGFFFSYYKMKIFFVWISSYAYILEPLLDI
jgi:hypothetical protein